MKLKSLLNPDLICFDFDAKSKEDVIDLFVDKFARYYKHRLDINKIKDSIYDRESLGGTVFAPGFAMPHGRLEDFADLIIGICFPKEPVKCDDIDVRMFIVLLTSKAGSSVYVQTLATFANMAKSENSLDDICSCKNIDEFFDKIKDITVKKELKIEDIMSKNLITVNEQTTLKEIADIYYKNHISYVPVVNDKGEIIGEVSMNQLLQTGIPDYAHQIGNLNFLTSFSPFEHLLKNEDNILAKDLMVKPEVVLKKEGSIIEAAFEMAHRKRRYLPVAQDTVIVGVVSYTDLLKKVIRS
ncbi:MAG: CBS domain-containing protein [Spirochaetes bacterium]|nr:CBS domain-containing protein [Spirochaetota bacterium]MBN2770699.1 CBS domain-containing protein [Spirochaetota bacterium]